MELPRFPRMCWNTWRRWRTPFVSSLLFFVPTIAQAQNQEASIEALANVLSIEDARNYDGPLLRTAARHADPIVRRHAALAIGRIGSSIGLPVLIELLSDPDST